MAGWSSYFLSRNSRNRYGQGFQEGSRGWILQLIGAEMAKK